MKRIGLTLFVLLASQSHACEQFVDIGKSQYKELANKVLKSDPMDIDAIYDYSTMVCAKDPKLRTHARAVGVKSNNKAVQEAALRAYLMEKESFVLEFVRADGLSKEQKMFIDENPRIVYEVKFRDVENACISTYSRDQCLPNYSTSVEGRKIIMVHNNNITTLELGSDGYATGTYNPYGKRSPKNLPVRMHIGNY